MKTLAQIRDTCMSNYEIYKSHKDNTVFTTQIPWTFVKRVGVWNIEVRYAKFGNNSPGWYWRIECGSMRSGSADSLEAAIFRAEDAADDSKF